MKKGLLKSLVIFVIGALSLASTSCGYPGVSPKYSASKDPLRFPTVNLHASKLASYALERTVRLDVICDGKLLGHGSGTILRSYSTWSLISTAKHVAVEAADNPNHCHLRSYDYLDTYRMHGVNSTRILLSKTDDIAVLVVPINYFVNTPIARAQDLYPGMAVVTAGYPAQPYPEAKGWRVSPSVACGSVSTLVFHHGNLVQLRVTTPLYFGYSGGGTFDARGRLVGVTSYLITNGLFRSVIPGFSHLVSSNRLRMFLAANQIKL